MCIKTTSDAVDSINIETTMKIGIIVAMDKELKLLLPLLENHCEIDLHDRSAHCGHIGGKDIVLIKCGIGKVNAAITTSDMIDHFAPDLIINSGVAGGANADMHPLDIVMATGVAYHDVWCGPGTQFGAAADMDVPMPASTAAIDVLKRISYSPKLKYGLICSGDMFISRREEVERIRDSFPRAMAVDMESGAIAQVCTQRGVAFNILRVISDTPGEADNISQYENFWIDAPEETFTLVKRLIESL